MRFPLIGFYIFGSNANGNPAASRYTKVMGGTDGGARSPLRFDPDVCYHTSRQKKSRASRLFQIISESRVLYISPSM